MLLRLDIATEKYLDSKRSIYFKEQRRNTIYIKVRDNIRSSIEPDIEPGTEPGIEPSIEGNIKSGISLLLKKHITEVYPLKR